MRHRRLAKAGNFEIAYSDCSRLRPHRAPVHPELTSHCVHAEPLCAGCSHSVHFLVGEACSRSFTWFHRRADQRVIGPILGLRIGADALTPRGSKSLDPWSPVPAAFHCFHVREPRFGGALFVCAQLGTERRPMGGAVLVCRNTLAAMRKRRRRPAVTPRFYTEPHESMRRGRERRCPRRSPRSGRRSSPGPPG